MIKILADDACDLTLAEAEALGVEIIHIKVRFGDREYVPQVDLQTEEFFDRLKCSKKLPTTSLINRANYEEIISKYLDNGDDVFVMCLSSGLSGSFECLSAVQKQINSPHLAVCDTENVSFGYRIIVQEAVKIAKSGASLTQLAEKVERIKKKSVVLAVIDDVSYLIKGGRLSPMAGIAVNALKIKPIVTVADKVVKVKGKSFGYRRGMNALLALVKDVDENKTVCFGHTMCPEKLQEFMLLTEQTLKLKSDNICSIGPIVGTHVGQGCVGISYFKK